MHLSKDAPFPRRFLAYLNERFPPIGHIVLIISYYSSNQFLAQAITSPGQPVHFSFWSTLGSLSVLCGFFYLRVFDEHKDYKEDRVNHPDRLLSRGIITLRELKIAGGVAIAVQLGLSAIRGPAALLGSLAVLSFAFLMLKEFFVGEWLRRHFLVYALSHMLIMPLYALQIFSFTTGEMPFAAPGWYIVYAFVGFFVTLNWEISRKIRAPEDEREGVESYSKIFGPYGAACAVLVVRILDTLLVAAVGYTLGLPWHFFLLLVALYLVSLYGFLQFRLHPSATTARALEKYAGLYIVAFDLVLALELAITFGLRTI